LLQFAVCNLNPRNPFTHIVCFPGKWYAGIRTVDF
jgi:hypothetical protein